MLAEVTTPTGEPCLYTRSATPAPGDEAGGQSPLTTTTLSPQPAPLPAYDPSLHGPALAIRLDWDYADVLIQRVSFERLLVHVVAAAVQQPQESITILGIMPGSTIVAMGVVPSTCINADISAVCLESLMDTRRLWLAALQSPDSELRGTFQ